MPGASMTKYATMNPLGSTDPRDMFDNAQNLDFAMSDIAEVIWTDRFGKKRNTFYGFELFARAAISAFGYITIDSFQAGATLTLYNQILRDTTNGEYYRWDGFFPPSGKVVPPGSTPASTGGQGFGAWLSVGSSALRSMLVSSGGAGMIGTLDGHTVQEHLDSLSTEADASASLINQHIASQTSSEGAGGIGSRDGRTVQKRLDDSDALLQQHLASLDPHPGLTAEINNAVAEAGAARDAAIAAAGPLYATIAEGRAAVTDGKTFAVQGSTTEIAATIYRRVNASSETLIATLPSKAFVDKAYSPNNNLVADGEFANGYAGWIPVTPVDIHKFVLDGKGHASVKATYMAESGIFEMQAVFGQTGSAKYPVLVGEKYTLSAEVDVDAPTAPNSTILARLSLRCFDASGTLLNRAETDITKLNRSGFNSGLRNVVSVTAPANASYMEAHIYRQSGPVYSLFGFGKVKVERGDFSPYSRNTGIVTDDGNMLYDPASKYAPSVISRATVEKNADGDTVIVARDIGVPAVDAQLYQSHPVICNVGDIFSFAFELDATGTGNSTVIAQIRGYDVSGEGVWSALRTIPVSGSVLWGTDSITRTLTCITGAPPSSVVSVVCRLVSVAGSNYTRLRAKNFTLKMGANNYAYSNYKREGVEDNTFISSTALPRTFNFWPYCWQNLGGAYDFTQFEVVESSFGETALSMKPAFIGNGQPVGILSEQQKVVAGDMVTYSVNLAGQLSSGSVVVGVSFYDDQGTPTSSNNTAVLNTSLSTEFTEFKNTYAVPAGSTRVAFRVLKNATAVGTSLLIKDPIFVKGDDIPLSFQPQGDLLAIGREIADMKAGGGGGSGDVVGWASGSDVSYYTGEASNAFAKKPAALGVPIDTPPTLTSVNSSTHITATRQLIMAPGIVKTGTRLWAVFSAGITSGTEAADDFNIIQYSDDEGTTWREAFYWKSPDTTKYRLNTVHAYLELDGSVTFMTGADATFSGGDNILGSWAFTVKNPQQVGGSFAVTRQWRVLPTGYINGKFDTDGRVIIIGGTPTSSSLTAYRGINFYKYDYVNHWLNREANYMPSVPAMWEEAQAVQLVDGKHMVMFRADTGGLRVAYSQDGLDDFAADTPPSFLPATTSSRFALRISPTGRLYLLYNAATDRKALTLALLNTSGTAVEKTILVEPRQGNFASYPDLKFAGDVIYMAWDYIRSTDGGASPEIVMAKLSEADFVANGSSAVLTSKVIATKNPNPYAG